MSIPPRQRFPWGATVAVVPTLAILVALGAWQVQRLHWKEDLLRQVAAARVAAPRDVAPVLAQAAAGKDVGYVRVRADCPQIETTPYLRVYAVSQGAAGYRLVTACALQGLAYRTLLVDRGFIGLDAVDRLKSVHGRELEQSIVGVLRGPGAKGLMALPNDPGQNIWHQRDIPAMARALGAPAPAPAFLMLESPAPQGFGPAPQALPIDIPNNHLGYAITWFGLAAALACMYGAMLYRRWRPVAVPAPHDRADSV